MPASEYFHSLLINCPFLWFPVQCKLLENVVVVAKSCPTPCDPMDCSTTGFLVLHCLPEFAQLLSTKSVMLFNYLASATPFSFLSSTFPSIKVFSNDLALHIWWPKYWSFSFSISPSDEYSGLISFRIDWFDLLAVQGTLSRVFSNTTVQKHQFLGMQPSLWSNSHIHTWQLKKP